MSTPISDTQNNAYRLAIETGLDHRSALKMILHGAESVRGKRRQDTAVEAAKRLGIELGIEREGRQG
jgi:hypothetical protein